MNNIEAVQPFATQFCSGNVKGCLLALCKGKVLIGFITAC